MIYESAISIISATLKENFFLSRDIHKHVHNLKEKEGHKNRNAHILYAQRNLKFSVTGNGIEALNRGGKELIA